MKARQSAKIAEIGEALVKAGCLGLDAQAAALGLSRSTTWTILKANHKASGLSAGIVSRILASPRLPAPVRIKLREYVEEKVGGSYGHSGTQLRNFTAGLSTAVGAQVRTTSAAGHRQVVKPRGASASQPATRELIEARNFRALSGGKSAKR
jgi:hypothetical protein